MATLYEVTTFWAYPELTPDYLNNLSNQISQLPKINGYLKYAAAEIPIYHYCFFPEIIAFKLYTWGRTTWDFNYLRDRKFSLDLMSPIDYEAASNFLHNYLKIPSVELWTLNSLDNTLSQLAYCVQSGNTSNPSDAILICNKLIELVNHLKKMAEVGKKFPLGAKEVSSRADFTLFHNETIYTGNSILVVTDLGLTAYSTFTNPNYIKSSNTNVVNDMDNWFSRVMSKSQLISKQAERSRQFYFNKLVKKINRTRLIIDRFIKEEN